AGGDLDRYRVAVESLTAEFDVLDVAAAGVKLAYEAGGGKEEEKEIPPPQVERPKERTGRPARPAARAARPSKPAPAPNTVTLFIGAGRNAGVRPADLFGA